MQGADAATSEGHPRDPWEALLAEAYLTAQELVSHCTWRGTFNGVLPRGFDTQSIAAEALLELLQQQPPPPDGRPPQAPPTLPNGELRRILWRHIDRLHRLKENSTTTNTPDLPCLPAPGGEWVNPSETISVDTLDPLETLLGHETEAETRRLDEDFSRFLGKERRLKRLYLLLRSGISTPMRLARRLKLSVREVTNLRYQLQRRLASFLAEKTSANPR